MAVKFSDFSQKQLVSDVTNLVGYLQAGELNVMIPPGNLDTTYVVSTGNSGSSPNISIQGTKPNQPSIAASTISLTGSGATLLNGNGSTAIEFASTAYSLTSTNTSPAGTVPLVLGKTGGGDLSGDNLVNLVGAGGIALTSSSNTITITGAGIDTTYTLVSQTSGGSVDLNLDDSAGGTDTIKLTPAGGLTITKSAGDVITLDTSALGDGTVTNVSSATPSLISVASQASTPAITAITSGGVGASSTSLATGAQIQAAINTAVAGLLDYKGGYDAPSNDPDLDSGSNIAILKGDAYTVTVAGTFFTEAVAIGDLLIANEDMAIGGSALTKWTTVQNNVGTAQVGATDGATAKGLAGFDNQMFATTANGFITSTTLNTVVITRVGAGNGLFYVDGTQQADITLMPDVTYLIDQSDASNDGHPLILSTTTPTKAEYATGVVYLIDNVPVANAAAYNTGFNGATTSRQLRVTLNQVAPTLYYVCYNHQNMGGNISGGGAPVKTVNIFNISGTSTNTLTVTSPTNPSSVNFIDVYINGVYQAKANATLTSVKTLTLVAGFYPDGAVIETVTTT